MSLISTIACVLILSGAAIMATNIYKFSKLLHIFNQFAVEGYRRFIIFYRTHQLLMLFFFIGYIVVFLATFFQIHIVSEFFVAVIFFFGAVFVLLGIILQAKMLNNINESYQKILTMSKDLDDERKRLVDANQNLKIMIEQRKTAEAEKSKLEEQLHRVQKMESLGLLAGGVAHDLNNVLSGIVSYPELLLSDLHEDSKLREPMKTIMESGHRAVAIVQDLLTVARGVASTKDPLRLNDLVSDYLISPEFKKLKQFYPSVTIKVVLADDLLNVCVSHVHIRKVVMNLVVNAFETIQGIGNVSISTENRYIDKPLKGYNEVGIGEYAVLSVSDNGTGITHDDLERIFEPFYTKKVMGRSGTGLGLAVVWNVVQDHEGYIDVKTGESGTIFDVYIPITRSEIFQRQEPLSIDSYKGTGEMILVVDDIRTQREISCKILDKLGYKSTSVSSGEEAIEYLQQNPADLVLLDMIMDPGISGYETYRRIIKIHPGQKAIILSGFSETEDVKKAQSIGAGKYVKKPVTMEKIGIAIKEELTK